MENWNLERQNTPHSSQAVLPLTEDLLHLLDQLVTGYNPDKHTFLCIPPSLTTSAQQSHPANDFFKHRTPQNPTTHPVALKSTATALFWAVFLTYKM